MNPIGSLRKPFPWPSPGLSLELPQTTLRRALIFEIPRHQIELHKCERAMPGCGLYKALKGPYKALKGPYKAL